MSNHNVNTRLPPQTSSPHPPVFITGGMSGLGKALAVEYLRRGASVALFDVQHNQAVLEQLQLQRCTTSQQVLAWQISITDAQGLAAAAAQAVAALGAPGLAINCAGVQRAQPFAQLSAQQFEQIVQVNLIGSRHFAAAVLPHMQAGACLALVASMAGLTINYSYAAYSASKFGVVGLGRVLRLEYKPLGIKVSVICPPEVDTPMVEQEKKHMHPASRQLKAMSGSLSVASACQQIVRGLDKGKTLIIPGRKAQLVYFAERYLPHWLLNKVVDKIVRSALNQVR